MKDGNLGLGLYIGPHCMQMAIDKAKKHGVGFVACKNSTVSLRFQLLHRLVIVHSWLIFTSHSITALLGTMPLWRQIKDGKKFRMSCPSLICLSLNICIIYLYPSIGLTGTNARPSIAPTFGVEPMMGTNPLTFGIPTSDSFPFVIDCATSVNQRGKIERYAREGVPTPRGAVIDDQGIERTDTDGILRDMVLGKCALTPVGGAGDKMGGYKGYGWAATVELLCTALQSGPWGEDICGIDRETGKPKPMPLGHFFLAIDIEKICPLDEFKTNSGNFLQALRDSRKAPNGPGR